MSPRRPTTRASGRAARTRRSWPQRLLLAVGIVVVLGAVLTAGSVAYIGYRWSQVTKYDVDLRAAAAGEPANYLIVGSDSRDNITEDDPDAGGFLNADVGEGQRSDTIILVRLDPQAGTAQLMSFPRDLWLPLADGSGNNRINAAYGHGRQVLIDTIERNFELEINHYVEVDFVAFRDIVDEVGGVALWFDQPVRDRGTGLLVETAGCHRLPGSQALNFARSRHLEYEVEPGRWVTDPTADLGRMTRQQIFIRRAVAQAVEQGWTNPARLNRLLGSVLPKVGVDKGIDAGALLELGRRFRNFDVDGLETHTLPTTDHRTSGGAAVQLVQDREAEPLLNLFRGLPPGALRPPFIDVEVRNGSGVDGQAGDVAAALEAIGFNIVDTGDHDAHVVRTTVFYGPDGYEAARRLALHVTGGAALVEDPSLSGARVALVTGEDLTTIHDQPAPDGSRDEVLSTTIPPAGPPPEEPPAEAEAEPGAEVDLDEPTTTTTVLGYATGEPPPGQPCG